MAKVSDSVRVDMSVDDAWAHASDLSQYDKWLTLHDGWRSALQVGRFGRPSKVADDGDGEGVEWPAQSPVGILADGVAARVEQLTALGNGQVPAVAAAAFRMLSGAI